MGKGPGKFSDLGKAASDLLSKDFGVGKNTVELKTKAPDAVTFTTNGTHKTGGAADASVQAECKPMAGLTVKGKIDTAGVTSTTFESENAVVGGLKLTLAGATPPLDKAGLLASVACGAEYSTDVLHALASYDYLKGGASCSAVTCLGPCKGGVSLAYDVNKGALKGYGAALSYGSAGYTLTGACAGDPKAGLSYNCTYHHAVSPDMQVAAQVGVGTDGKTSIAAVGSWVLDAEATAKAKVDSCGMLGLSYKRKLSKATTVTFAGCFDLSLDGSKTKTGIALNLAP